MQREHFLAIKKKKTRKTEERERDQKTTYSLTPIAVKFLMYTKELRNIGGRKSPRVIIPHIFTKEPYLLSPSTALNTIHPKKEQSHEINLALLAYMVEGNPAFSWSAGFERFRQPTDLVSQWLG
jgi:hypothetical protein